jgi:hypothetical protein
MNSVENISTKVRRSNRRNENSVQGKFTICTLHRTVMGEQTKADEEGRQNFTQKTSR